MNGPARRPLNQRLNREAEIDPLQTALLLVDMQNYNCTPEGGEYAHLEAAEREQRYGYLFRTLKDSAPPNLVALQLACPHGHIEVMYTVIGSLTIDRRDGSLDYKIERLLKLD